MENEVLAATAQPLDAASPEAAGERGGGVAVDEGHGVGGDADGGDGAAADARVEIAAYGLDFRQLRHKAVIVRRFCGLKPAASGKSEDLLRRLPRSLQEIDTDVNGVEVTVEYPVQPYLFIVLGLLVSSVMTYAEFVGNDEEFILFLRGQNAL